MSERTHRRRIVAQLKAKGAIVLPFVGGRESVIGSPDCIISHWAWSGYVEFKGAKTVTQPHQRKMHNELRRRGDECIICREGKKLNVELQRILDHG